MKYIMKKSEPSEFAEWKEQEKDNLESCYKRPKEDKPSECAWNNLPSNLPINAEEGIIYYSKKQLKGELLDEQGLICAFCTDKLENNHHCTIDHLQPKSENPRENTFDYFNLLAVCEGKNPSETPLKGDLRHCNNKKDNNPIEVSPLEPTCEENFIFDAFGKIYPNPEENENAANTIEKLGLNSPILVRKRKEEIDRILFPFTVEFDDNRNIIESIRQITRQEALSILTTIDQRSGNQFKPFCITIKQVLQTLI